MWFTFAATLGGLGSIVGAFPAEQFMLLVLGVFSVLLQAPVAGTLMLDSWRASRSDGKPPPSAARPGHAIQDWPSQDEPDGQNGNNPLSAPKGHPRSGPHDASTGPAGLGASPGETVA
jgi:hypothetical protein